MNLPIFVLSIIYLLSIFHAKELACSQITVSSLLHFVFRGKVSSSTCLPTHTHVPETAKAVQMWVSPALLPKIGSNDKSQKEVERLEDARLFQAWRVRLMRGNQSWDIYVCVFRGCVYMYICVCLCPEVKKGICFQGNYGNPFILSPFLYFLENILVTLTTDTWKLQRGTRFFLSFNTWWQ